MREKSVSGVQRLQATWLCDLTLAPRVLGPITVPGSASSHRDTFVYNASMGFHRRRRPGPHKAKSAPPEETFEEAAFLKSLCDKQKAVSIKMMDGDTMQGYLEYYDKTMVRLTRHGAPNLFIFKHEIMYIAEDSSPKRNPA